MDDDGDDGGFGSGRTGVKICLVLAVESAYLGISLCLLRLRADAGLRPVLI